MKHRPKGGEEENNGCLGQQDKCSPEGGSSKSRGPSGKNVLDHLRKNKKLEWSKQAIRR